MSEVSRNLRSSSWRNVGVQAALASQRLIDYNFYLLPAVVKPRAKIIPRSGRLLLALFPHQ